MTTSKTLIGGTLVFVLILMAGVALYPSSILTAFAGSSAGYMMLRIVVAILLVGLLFTTPPRTKLFRAMLGVWAFALAVTAGQLLLNYQLYLLDAVLFLEVAIIFGIEALETSPIKAGKPVARKIPVRKISVRRRITVATASS